MISHVAIEDVNTVSTDERILNSFMMWCFTFFYAFLFANIASIVADMLGRNFLIFHERYNNIMSMLPKDKIPAQLLLKISQYYDFKWATAQGFDERQHIFQELPAQLKYDIMLSRYSEAISASVVFRNEQAQIDIPLANSLFQAMKVRVYMQHDYIVKAGSYGQDMFIVLDGEALMFGLNNQLLGIMRSGTHYNNLLGEMLVEQEREKVTSKAVVHIFAKTLCIVGVVKKASLEKMFEAYPYWQQIVTRLNRAVFAKGKKALDSYLKTTLGLEPTFENELTEIENVKYSHR